MAYQEIAVLAYLIQDKNSEFVEEVKDGFFEEEESREVFRIILDLKSKQKKLTTRDIAFVGGSKYSDILRKIRRYLRDLPSRETIAKFIAIKNLKDALLEEIPKFTSLKIDVHRLKEALAKVEAVYFKEVQVDSSSLENFEYEALKYQEEEKESPCQIKGVTLRPGEVGMWLGPPKRGKTLALINTGAVNLVHGMKVFHWSLEISKLQVFERYCSRLLGRKVETEEDIELAKKRVKLLGGKLEVKDDPYCHIFQIKEWISKGEADMLIVDYADLIVPPRKMKERRFELRDIFLALRELAKEFKIPVWTASQAVAKSEKKTIIKLEDLEEAKIVKAGISSLVVSLNQTEEELEDNVMRTFIVVSTRPFGRKQRFFDVNYPAQYMKEVERK